MRYHSDFIEDLDGLRVDIASGLGACARNFNKITGSGAEDALGKVTAAGITGAKNENERFVFHYYPYLAATSVAAAR